MAAISLGLVGHAAFGERLGRNARYASIGAGLSAAAMAACGHMLSAQSVFLVTAALILPALLALSRIRSDDVIGPVGPAMVEPRDSSAAGFTWGDLLKNRPLIAFAACILLFQLANAAMLPLMGGVMAKQASEWATLAIGACLIVPQLVVAGFSPWIGRQSAHWGRRPLLVVAFAAVALRGLIFAVASHPYAIIAAQLLDGVSAAVIGIMLPLVVADVSRRTGRFNL
jgi:hypothetical protein